ncbi:MAG: hypothetical protein P1P81_08150 [Desulfobulbales bacterium]|nr:hypothetical protein [Desulfobulbales bacterium]
MPAANENNMSARHCPHCRRQLPPPCPRCESLCVARNGKTKSRRQNYLCGGCGKQFVADLCRRRISPQTWAIVDTLIRAGVPVKTIHRATGIGERSIYNRKSALESKT